MTEKQNLEKHSNCSCKARMVLLAASNNPCNSLILLLASVSSDCKAVFSSSNVAMVRYAQAGDMRRELYVFPNITWNH